MSRGRPPPDSIPGFNPRRPRRLAQALEPRLLFDGAGLTTLAETNQPDHPDPAAKEPSPAAPAIDPAGDTPAAGRDLLLIDPTLPDAQVLAGAARSGVEVRLLDPQQPIADQVLAAVRDGAPVESLAIVSHGGPGELLVAGRKTDLAGLEGGAASWQAVGGHLAPGADLRLYGCDVGAGAAGQAFVATLAALTGADVAASSDPTAGVRGDWDLETATGTVQSASPFVADALTAYVGTLTTAPTVSDAVGTARSTAEDTALAITGITVADPESAETQTVTLGVAHGTLTLAGTAGLSFTTGDGSGDASMTFSGSLAAVNAAIATLTYQPAADYSGGDTLSVSASDGDQTGSLSVAVEVTPVNDAPSLATAVPLAVSEGGSAVFSLAQLAASANALDADIATGQQVLVQQMVQITSLPTKGTLSYNGGAVVVGSVVPVANLAALRYTHGGSDVAAPDSDAFGVVVSDGGGGATAGSVTIAIAPANVAPVVTGAPVLIEGQVKGVAPTIALGDGFDTLANATIVIDDVVTGGQGTLFIDADGDDAVDPGEAITGTTTLSAAQRLALPTQLKFFHNGAEPNAPGAIAPAFRITVTDAGGGTGTPSAPVARTITLDVQPNNDDPTLDNAHATPAAALAVAEGTSATLLTSAMLRIADVDRNPADPLGTTPSNQLVYTIGTRPAQGEIQLFVGGGLGPEGDGWIVLGDGGRFTQQQVDAGQVRYYQTTDVPDGAPTPDGFTFTVRDSAFGFDVWTDPASPTGPREGGLRDTPTGPIATQGFFFAIAPQPARVVSYEGPPRPATAGYGGADQIYTFAPGVMTNGNAGALWNEANVGAGGGYVLTGGMLSYEITRTDTKGTVDPADDESVVVPEDETVYTLTVPPPNGTLQRLVGGTWQTIPTNGQFTQQDVDDGRIRFVHDGSENHTAAFGYTVSDGTPNNFASSFAIDVTPTNDRPVAAGGAAQVLEGAGNAVRLGGGVLGTGDVDRSLDPAKRVGEGAADFLWFRVTGLAADGGATPRGALERWDGAAWVAVDTATWLPASLLSAGADGGTSGLRYVHDGSEPLAYPGAPRVTFGYVVRDDLADPADPFATNATAPADASGSAQSNESAPATVTIDVVPVNNPPQVADRPGDPDPVIGGTIAGGGATSGVNEILANVREGATATITSAHLTAVDSDNTTVQRQYRITGVPTLGVLLLGGRTLGVGSTFTQDDVDSNRLSYRHGGGEIGAPTTDALGTYDDKFTFVVNDGVLEDAGNAFLVTLQPTNDAPVVTGPAGPVNLDSASAAGNPVAGFAVADPDLASVGGGEQDFLQVVVRLLDAGGTPIGNYATGFAGGGVSIGYATGGAAAGVVQVGAFDGTDDYLVLQGTRAQVDAALAGLTVTFANDLDATYRLQVIADDRLRDGLGALLDADAGTPGTQAAANGGTLNQAATAGGVPTAVPTAEYGWYTAAVPTGDRNLAASTVTLRASSVNDPATLTGPGAQTISEDVTTRIGGFTVADAESAAFDLPVTVTLSVPAGQGTLGVGGAGTQASVTPAAGQPVTISGDNSGSITLTGRASDIQAVLAGATLGLTYTGPANGNHDYNGADAGDVTLTVRLDDAGARIGGDTGSGSVAANPPDVLVPITLVPTNDAPTVSASATPVTVAQGGVATAVSGFAVNDVDYADGGLPDVTAGEADFVQVVVRLATALGSPLPAGSYAGTSGQDVVIGSTSAPVEGPSFEIDDALNGTGAALAIRGTRGQVNAYLDGLTVAFSGALENPDATYRVEVIADDRLRTLATGVLDGSGAANGGLNPDGADGDALPDAVPVAAIDPYAALPAGLGANVAAAARNVFVSGVNDPAAVTAGNVVVNEASASLLLNATNANFTVADPDDNGAASLSATVTVTQGTITGVGGSGGSVAGRDTATVTITGATEAQLNSRLRALTLTFPDEPGVPDPADWNGSLTVTVVVNDGGSTGQRPGSLVGDTNDAAANPGDFAYADGASANLVTTRTITVTVNAVNDAPTRTDATPVALAAVAEDVPGGTGSTPPGATVAVLFGGKFSDARDGITGGSSPDGFAGIAITANASIAAQGVWQYSTDGSTWTNLPTVSSNNALLLSASTSLRFVPAADFHGAPGGLTARLVDTSGGAVVSGSVANVSNDTTLSGGTTRYSNSGNAVTLTTAVTNVNDRPTGTGTTLPPVAEDTASPPGATVASLGFGYSDATDDRNPATNSTGGVTGGANAATAFGGIAVVGNAADAAQGVWQYNDNAGSGWVTIGSPSDGAALLLPTTASLRFVPSADFNGTPGGLTVRVSDAPVAFGTASDITATLADPTSQWSTALALGTSVAARNDAPTVTAVASSPRVAENTDTATGNSVPPTRLVSPGVVVADPDLASTPALSPTVFGAGTITVSLTDAYRPGDVLFIDAVLPADVTVAGGSAGALTVTLDGDTTLAEVAAILEAVAYRSTSDDPTLGNTDTDRAYRIVVSDGNNVQPGGDAGGPAALAAAAIDGTLEIVPTNDPPVVDLNGAGAGRDNAVTFTEGANVAHVPVTVAAGATLSDVDNTRLTAMTITVGGLRDGDAEVLGIGGTSFPLATDATDVDVGAFRVSYVAATGTFTIVPAGGSVAAVAAFEALLRGITYVNATDHPTAGDRTIDVRVTDAGLDDAAGGGQLQSNLPRSTITVVPANDQPVISGLGAVAFFENDVNAAARLIDGSVTLTDVDSPDYAGGSLRVSGLLAGQDVVSLPTSAAAVAGSVRLVGAVVEYHDGAGWVAIGTASGGSGSDFVVSFGAGATPAIVERVVESLTYANGADNPVPTRTLALAVDDGDGGAVQTATVDVTVRHDNDAPAMTATTVGGSYTEQDPGGLALVGGAVSVSDPDGNANFYDGGANVGSLVVALDAYRAGDRLYVRDEGSGAGQIGVAGSSISFGGVAFATAVGGAGTDLGITFTSNAATPAAVQALLRQLRFDNLTNDDPTADGTDPTRGLTITLNDGGNTRDPGSATGPLTATLTGTIRVVPVADAPVLAGGGATLAYEENAPAAVIDPTVRVTSDPDDTLIAGATVTISGGFTPGDALGFAGLAGITASYDPTAGVLTLTGNATLADYTAALRSVTFASSSDDPTALGATRTISWQVTDADSDGAGTAASNVVTSTVTIDATPDLAPDAAATSEDRPVTIGILANDDLGTPGGAITALDAVSARGGTVALGVGGTVTYTPPADFVGTDTFTYTWTDGNGDVRATSVTVTVSPVVDIADDAGTTPEDTPIITAVLANDSFAGVPVVTGVTQGAHGRVSVNPDGTITYAPDPDFNGVDSYTYTVTSNGVTETATVTITVTPVNDPPVAVADDGPTVRPGRDAVFTPGTLLSNDRDVDGDPLVVVAVGPASVNGGTVVLRPDGTVAYTPRPGFVGPDTFSYTISDGRGGFSTATVRVLVASDTYVAPPKDPFGPDPFRVGGREIGHPDFTQPFEPALFVLPAVEQARHDLLRLNDAMARYGRGFAGEIGAESLGDGLGVVPAQYVLTHGVAYARALSAEAAIQSRVEGNSVLPGGDILVGDFSPFKPGPAPEGVMPNDSTSAPTADGAPSFTAQLRAVAAIRQPAKGVIE